VRPDAIHVRWPATGSNDSVAIPLR